jgi:drug/metabolite transporter (DMT)-like permease
MVPILSVPLLGERLSALGVAGIATVLVGIFTLHMRAGSWKQSVNPSRTPGSRWALLAGALITFFSLVDKVGVENVEPLPYVYLIFSTSAIFFTPFAFRQGIAPVRETWRINRKQLAALGLLIPTAYGLIVFAYTLAPVAYVVASREVRLVLGTLIGAVLLKEGHAAYRLTGSGFIVLGVVLLAFAE